MRKVLTRYSLLLVVLLGMAVRLPLLNGSFWLDEAAQALESTRPFSEQFQLAKDFQPPLFHLLIFVAAQVSTAEWFLRLVGATLPGLLTLVALFYLVKKLWNSEAALLASLLLATSSFHVFYSQELRPYALAALFGVLSTSFLLDILTSEVPRKKTQILYVLTTAAGLYTMYVLPFLVLGQFATVFFIYKKKLWMMIRLVLVAGLLWLPWLPSFLTQLQVGAQLRQDLPGWSAAVGTPFLKAVPLTVAKFLYGVSDVSVSVFYILPVLGLCFLGIAARGTLWKQLQRKEVRFLAIITIGTLVFTWLFSLVIPVLQPKRVLFLLPLFIALALGVLSAKRSLQYALFLLLLCCNALSLGAYWRTPALQREDWRGLHTTLLARYPSGSVVVFAFPDSFAPWEWYDRGQTPKVLTPYTQKETAASLEAVLKKTTEYEYVLVFDYLRDLTDPEHKIETTLGALGLSEREKIDGGSIGFVRVFSRRPAVLSYVEEGSNYAFSRH